MPLHSVQQVIEYNQPFSEYFTSINFKIIFLYWQTFLVKIFWRYAGTVYLLISMYMKGFSQNHEKWLLIYFATAHFHGYLPALQSWSMAYDTTFSMSLTVSISRLFTWQIYCKVYNNLKIEGILMQYSVI